VHVAENLSINFILIRCDTTVRRPPWENGGEGCNARVYRRLQPC